MACAGAQLRSGTNGAGGGGVGCKKHTMYRIYFDGNDANDQGNYLLGFNKSIEDLARIPGGPKEGMTVTIYMIGEIEMEAVLEWDEKWKAWTARPNLDTTRDNYETWD
jgi:hypothetical protein